MQAPILPLLRIGPPRAGLLLALVSAGTLLQLVPEPTAFVPRPPTFADAAIRCQGDACSVDRLRLDRILDSRRELATATRLVPAFRRGRIGLRIYRIRSGSALARLGLRNGDTIWDVNGVALDDTNALDEWRLALRTSDEIRVDIERHGRQRTLRYSIN